MAGAAVDVKTFDDLFKKPTIAGMYALNPKQFEGFVRFVFERGGYTVRDVSTQYGRGLDLELYTNAASAQPVAAIQVKRNDADNPVTTPTILNFLGALTNAGGIPGYLITTSSFNTPARQQASVLRQIRLIDGERLVRFVKYLRGSRHRGAPGTPISPDILLEDESVDLRHTSTTKVLALANNKGGVGKTTTALNLAFLLARLRKNVLLVDMDAQANLTQSVLREIPRESPNLADYFARHATLMNILRPTQFERVWLLPGHPDMRLADAGLASWPELELRFARDLHSAELRPPHYQSAGEFDWIILDTPPAMSLHTRSAISAAHYILAPVVPSAFAASGFTRLLETVSAMGALTGTEANVLGCVMTFWQENAIRRDTLQDFQINFLNASDIRLFNTKIPYDQNIERAHREEARRGRSLFTLSKRMSAGAKGYTDLLEEVLKHVNDAEQ